MIRNMRNEEFDFVYSFMEKSFPLDEYRPYEEQKALLSDKRYSCYVLTDAKTDAIQGFAMIWRFNDFAFIEHLAVNPELRNRGLGATLLKELEALLDCTICLEVELPETEMAKRRIGFYQRNGFFYNDYPYVQPPISKGRNPIELRIMTWGKEILEDEFLHMKTLIHREVYKV